MFISKKTSSILSIAIFLSTAIKYFILLDSLLIREYGTQFSLRTGFKTSDLTSNRQPIFDRNICYRKDNRTFDSNKSPLSKLIRSFRLVFRFRILISKRILKITCSFYHLDEKRLQQGFKITRNQRVNERSSDHLARVLSLSTIRRCG